jgi:hypothetical protein
MPTMKTRYRIRKPPGDVHSRGCENPAERSDRDQQEKRDQEPERHSNQTRHGRELTPAAGQEDDDAAHDEIAHVGENKRQSPFPES